MVLVSDAGIWRPKTPSVLASLTPLKGLLLALFCQKITRCTTGARGCYFLTSVYLKQHSTSVKKIQIILISINLKPSLAHSVYHRLFQPTLAISSCQDQLSSIYYKVSNITYQVTSVNYKVLSTKF